MRRLDSVAVEHLLDQVVEHSFQITPPAVVYHYTDWNGAAGILKSQEFWSTAHVCTNDPAEIVTADAAIVDVAKTMQQRSQDGIAELLTLFVESYPKLQIGQMTAIYLSCFSLARDDRGQWCRYADGGAGVCLGVRVLSEPGPPSAHIGVGSFLVDVDYTEDAWRTRVAESFEAVLAVMRRDDVPFSRPNVEQALSALHRIAAMASIRAKTPEWASEQELRHVTIAHPDASLAPKERQSRGHTVRYLPVVVRADNKRIALGEVLIGPNQDGQAGCKQMQQLLDDAAYKVGDFEYPAAIAGSAARPCE